MRMEHRGLRWLLAAFWLIFAFMQAQAQTQTAPDSALSVYEEGKKLYDAGDFNGARSKFNEAVKIEPGNARWHYNLGLTHRQMKNLHAARESLMKARELDPTYKRDEISLRLAGMGFDADGRQAHIDNCYVWTTEGQVKRSNAERAALQSGAVPQGIVVKQAAYGGNCLGKGRPNPEIKGMDPTAHVSAACNGAFVCIYKINRFAIGDPSLGCAKNYIVDYTCPGGVRTELQTAPEATGKFVTLNCVTAPAPGSAAFEDKKACYMMDWAPPHPWIPSPTPAADQSACERLNSCATLRVQGKTTDPRGLLVYEEGKKLYDAGDFNGARSKFNEAVKIEPGNARWHYNLGLTHRQMENLHAASESLMKARELDPGYKRNEISQKLADMGFNPTTGEKISKPSNASSDPGERAGLMFALVASLLVLVAIFAFAARDMNRHFFSTNREAEAPAHTRELPPDAAEVAAIGRRLDVAARQLVLVEHSLRFTEHADLRSQLDHATQLEQDVRTRLAAAREGDATEFRTADWAMGKLEETARGASDLARKVFGAAALAAGGERIACYFCARPLANPDYRRPVAIKRSDTRTSVVSCPGCAAKSAQGQAPEILVAEDGKTHWSEIPGFDPYAARHSALEGVRRMPAWRYAPQRSFAELAMLAAGSTLAGGAIASILSPDQTAADEPLLDLDAAQEAGLARQAARAAAKQARQHSSTDHSSSDHS